MTTNKATLPLDIGAEILDAVGEAAYDFRMSRNQITEILCIAVILIERLRHELPDIHDADDYDEALEQVASAKAHFMAAFQANLEDLLSKRKGRFQRPKKEPKRGKGDVARVTISPKIRIEFGAVAKRWNTDIPTLMRLLYTTFVHVHRASVAQIRREDEFLKHADSLPPAQREAIAADLYRAFFADIADLALCIMGGVQIITKSMPILHEPLELSHDQAIADMVLMADLAEARGNKELAAALADVRKIAKLLDIIDN